LTALLSIEWAPVCVKLGAMRDGTDAEVLSWGFRSRLALLSLLIAGALSAALWSGLRDQGIGEPEDRRKLMVVTQPGSAADYHAVLEQGGFVIEVEDFADWESDARAQLPESEAQGVALLLEYADLRGFGFVVFEAPAQLDFSAVELEPSLDELTQLDQRDHAVLSVGDLAFPHRLSVDEVGEHPIVRMPGHGVLEAVFQQPAVSAREDDDRPTVPELQYEEAIEPARRMVERPATFAESIATAQATIDRSLAADTNVRRLVGPFTTGSAVPTPEGVLLVHHSLETYSDNALTLEQRAGDTMHFEWLGEAALARDGGELEPEPCPSLLRGSIVPRPGVHIEAAVDGSTLAIATHEQVRIWRKLAQPGCTWVEQAQIADRSILGAAVLAPRVAVGPEGVARSIMAESGLDDTHAHVRLWLTALTGDATSAPGQIDPELIEVIELLRVPDAQLTGLAFIDDVHLVALARVPLPPEEQTTTRRAEHALHLLDRRRPGAHLRIPAEFFADERIVRELAVVEPAVEREHGPRLALTLVDNGVDTELVVLTIAADAWQRFVDGEAADVLFTVTPEELELRSLGRAPAIAALSVGPGAIVYALAQGGVPAEIAVRSLEGGSERRLTNNELVDTLPRLTADGRAVVFVTGVRSSLSDAPFSVPRIAWLPVE
jgi:hypothetical protein